MPLPSLNDLDRELRAAIAQLRALEPNEPVTRDDILPLAKILESVLQHVEQLE